MRKWNKSLIRKACNKYCRSCIGGGENQCTDCYPPYSINIMTSTCVYNSTLAGIISERYTPVMILTRWVSIANDCKAETSRLCRDHRSHHLDPGSYLLAKDLIRQKNEIEKQEVQLIRKDTSQQAGDQVCQRMDVRCSMVFEERY
jgi:hypothetical protein